MQWANNLFDSRGRRADQLLPPPDNGGPFTFGPRLRRVKHRWPDRAAGQPQMALECNGTITFGPSVRWVKSPVALLVECGGPIAVDPTVRLASKWPEPAAARDCGWANERLAPREGTNEESRVLSLCPERDGRSTRDHGDVILTVLP